MVSSKIDVHSKSSIANSKAHCWTSSGAGTFSIRESDEMPHRGTKIVVHLNDDQKQFASTEEVTRILHEYSNFVPYPILLDGTKLNTVEVSYRNKMRSEEGRW